MKTKDNINVARNLAHEVLSTGVSEDFSDTYRFKCLANAILDICDEIEKKEAGC